ncbi:MAG TPA: cytochrome c peroxidase [Phycisphaerales bacterium]|nr:cytochrome c peroxidase [Phycisphaerales bacterium]
MRLGRLLGLCTLASLALATAARALPPVPVPPGNPITESKRVLGKILFWDEQLSVDGTVACATCHSFGRGGGESRRTRVAGPDSTLNTPDDIFGSPGITRSDSIKDFIRDSQFGTGRQVTGRNAPSPINAAYSPALFWDGRATAQFIDPETGQVSIQAGGALESQAVGPVTNAVEMGHDGILWPEVTARLARATPLALATGYPADVASALAGKPGYPELFQRAFGDGAVTADRVARAIATYERTLIADQTPYDLFLAGQTTALTPNQQQGLNRLQSVGPQGTNCTACHTPPLFTDHSFRNLGLRPPTEDPGRQLVTGNAADRGKMRVPSLRNVALRASFMHNGVFANLGAVFGFYDRAPGVVQFTDNQDPVMPTVRIPPPDGAVITDFLTNGLVDPRVRNETFPFDHPVLFSSRAADQPVIITGNGVGVVGTGAFKPQIIAVSPPMLGNPDFRIGMDRALGGAAARLLVSTSPPVGGRITPTRTFETKIASGTGAGNGVATNHWNLTPGAGNPLAAGQTMYAQWEVDDAGAPGGKAYSTIAQFRLFCPSGGCPLCEADMNADGALSTADIFSFLNAWFAGDPRADYNGDSLLEVQDIFDFLNGWFGGC